MKKKSKNKNGGYTLIETLISVALFIVIVTIGMGALLNADSLYNKSKDMRSVMDNLSFTMEDMSRNLRTGYNYHCIPGRGSPTAPTVTPLSGSSCMGIEFQLSSPGNPLWAYEVPFGQNIIQKGIYDVPSASWNWVQLTPTEVNINTASPIFSVFGAEPPTGTPPDYQQPFVNINLSGTIIYKTNVTTTFSLQTSVSQREIDI